MQTRISGLVRRAANWGLSAVVISGLCLVGVSSLDRATGRYPPTLEVVHSAFAQSTQGMPFRRMSEPLQLTVGPESQPTMVPQSYLNDPVGGQPLSSFMVVNPNQVWVRFKGFSSQADCTNVGVTPTTGWLVPPGFVGVFSTQRPVCGAVMAVSMPGYEIKTTTTFAPLEWSYGPGQ